MTYRIIFMGTPDFALESLKEIKNAGYNVVAVYTQPPKPKGRGHKEQKSPVHEFAINNNIPVYTPISLKKNLHELEKFQKHNADLAVVAAYGLILPKEILNAPRLGCVNIHASLLPRWRGAAPIQRCIQNGDKETGITIMQMNEGLDTGDIIEKKSLKIEDDELYETLHEKLKLLGANCITEILEKILDNRVNKISQPEIGVTYAHKLNKEESELDVFNFSSEILERKVRAFNPWPGVFINLYNEKIKIIKASHLNKNINNQEIGKIFKNEKSELFIICKEGILKLEVLQNPGSKACSAKDFINGYEGLKILFDTI